MAGKIVADFGATFRGVTVGGLDGIACTDGCETGGRRLADSGEADGFGGGEGSACAAWEGGRRSTEADTRVLERASWARTAIIASSPTMIPAAKPGAYRCHMG